MPRFLSGVLLLKHDAKIKQEVASVSNREIISVSQAIEWMSNYGNCVHIWEDPLRFRVCVETDPTVASPCQWASFSSGCLTEDNSGTLSSVIVCSYEVLTAERCRCPRHSTWHLSKSETRWNANGKKKLGRVASPRVDRVGAIHSNGIILIFSPSVLWMGASLTCIRASICPTAI